MCSSVFLPVVCSVERRMDKMHGVGGLKSCNQSMHAQQLEVVCDFGSEVFARQQCYFHNILKKICHIIVFCRAVAFSFNFTVSVQYHTLEIECQFLVSAQSHMPHFSSLELQ